MVQVFVMIKIFKYDKLMEFWLWWKKKSPSVTFLQKKKESSKQKVTLLFKSRSWH